MSCPIALLTLLASFGTAHAQSQDAVARARTHFEAGQALYRLSNYTDAIREFSAGYDLVPKPQFLINVAQCYDRIASGTPDVAAQRDALEHARDLYKKYLLDAPPGDNLRGQVAALVVEDEKRLQELPPPPPKAQPQVTAPPPAPVVTHEAPPPPPGNKKSGIARYWWLIPVAAVVVVGVSLGAYYGTRPTGPDCSTASFGCVDASKPGLLQY
jgi:hypothetical protein